MYSKRIGTYLRARLLDRDVPVPNGLQHHTIHHISEYHIAVYNSGIR